MQSTEHRPALGRPAIAEIPAGNGQLARRAERRGRGLGKLYAQHRKGVWHVAAVRIGDVLS